jgi:hypothetical protein
MKYAIKVYVAGAYSDTNVIGVLRNIGRGEHYAAELFMKGFSPFTPWHDKDFVIKNWDKEQEVEMFYKYSMEWLRASDCVFIVPNAEGLRNWQDSGGTLKEIEEAEKLGIPVFYDLEALLDHYKDEL